MMKYEGGRTPLKAHRLLCVIVPLMILLITAFTYQNMRRIYLQNLIYTKEADTDQADSIDDLLDYCSGSILMYADTVDAVGDITRYEKNSPFQSLFLVEKDGTLRYGNTVKDIRATDIVTRGMQGKNGIMVDYNAIFSEGVSFVFYAPVYENGSLERVVVGVLAQAQFAKALDSKSFGSPSMTYLVSTEGQIISASNGGQEWIGKNLFLDYHREDTFLSTTLDGLNRKQITKEALSTVLYNGGSFGYNYRRDGVSESAYVKTLKHSDYALMRVFPESVTTAMKSSVNRSTITVAIAQIALFAVYLFFVILESRGQNTKLKKENETVHQILEAFYGIYYRFCVVDLMNDTYEYLEMGNLEQLGIPKRGRYTELCQQLSGLVNHNVADGDIWMKYNINELKVQLSPREPVMRREVYMQVDGGKWETVTFSGLNYSENTPQKMIFAIQDVTAEHERIVRLNQTLWEASQDANAANAAKSDFLSHMSHDIRTPLNGILGMTAIAKHHKNEPERVQNCIAKIQSSGEFLLGLVNEILDISKIESGKIVLEKQKVFIRDLLEEVYDMIQVSARKKHQQLIRNDQTRHHWVIADFTRLKSILVNILSNAVKYTPENGTIECTVSEKRMDASGNAEFLFECKDNGIGMSEEFLATIFEPFSRADDKTVQSEQGTGLGLCIVKNMARLMGGDVTVSSKLGEGSTFRVYVSLAVCEDEDREESAQDEDGLEAEVKFRGLRCLLVDDNELNCEIAREILEMTEIGVEIAGNGREAVEMYENHPDEYYQIILMDVQMPVMNGYEATKAIRASKKQDSKSIPIIALTANAYAEDIRASIDAGMNEHLAKPIHIEELYRMMRKFIAQ